MILTHNIKFAPQMFHQLSNMDNLFNQPTQAMSIDF